MTRMVPFVVLLMPLLSVAQTASTGQIAGAVRDASGAAVPGAQLKLTMSESNATRSSRTDREGRYAFALLAPGTYQIDVDASGFGGIEQKSIPVRVTETTVIDINLQVASIVTTTTVESGAELVQTASSALGRIVESAQLVSLPLATRNYTQILALSPGVVANVANAGALGRNSLEISALGGRFADNNVQINGADGNNVFTTNMSGDGAGGAQGIAVPAPDSIREFKVQTGLYDASTGRNGGASVNVVTKSGGNHWHGNLYHFFRNEAFNAGEFFLNRAGQPKPRLRQNQFGFTLGGPLRKDSTFFFVSYEGNRQNNGVTGGATSAAFLPPLTDDRSAGALGRKFGGQRGAFGGVAVSNDGSNINPVAMRLLNQKLADGTYMIPTPQLLLPNGFGQSNYSVPARFREDQFNANLDQHFGSHDSLSFKFFFAQTEQTVPFGAGSNVPGFPSLGDGRNENASLSWVHIFRPNLLNEARVSFARLRGVGSSDPVLNSADVGIKTPPHVGVLPNIGFLSFPLAFGASQPPLGSAVNNFQYADSIAYHRGAHRIRAGAEFKRIQSNVLFDFDRRSILRFQTFPDFLIGLPFAQNQGSQPFSNVFVSSARSGLIGRAQRMSDFSTYVQDDFNPHPRLSLNIGLRYEIYGQVSDATGRLANFELGRAAAEPPASGTLTGFVVAANSIGSTPSGVVRLDKNTIQNGDHNNWAPRFGFAWRPLVRKTVVLRGGYGAYFSRPGTVTLFQSGPNLPFALISTRSAAANQTASFADPFDPALPNKQDFPLFLPRVATSNLFVNAMDPGVRSPTVHQWGLNLQLGFARMNVFEAGYVGTRGTGLIGRYRFNQPQLASPENPVHGQTATTTANVILRAPTLGIDPASSQLHTNGFSSNYHSLQLSLIRRMHRGMRWMASYTFSHSLDNLTLGDLQAVGGFDGDARNRNLNRASSDYDRRQRLVWNFDWQIPRLRVGRLASIPMNGWMVSGIATLQSGLPFSVFDSTAATVFAANSRAHFAPGVTVDAIPTAGSVNSRITSYFKAVAFTTAPAAGNGTGFGNSGRNILRGPDQRNFDLSAVKRFVVRWPDRDAHVDFRAEFFNAFNTVNFGQPGNNRAAPLLLGAINNTTVAPRILQFALKFTF